MDYLKRLDAVAWSARRLMEKPHRTFVDPLGCALDASGIWCKTEEYPLHLLIEGKPVRGRGSIEAMVLRHRAVLNGPYYQQVITSTGDLLAFECALYGLTTRCNEPTSTLAAQTLLAYVAGISRFPPVISNALIQDAFDAGRMLGEAICP